MNTGEHSTEVKTKVIQKNKIGKGYKIISSCLDIPACNSHKVEAASHHPGTRNDHIRARGRLVREVNSDFEGATEESG